MSGLYKMTSDQIESLEFAFSIDNWTPEDINYLCENRTIRVVKELLFNHERVKKLKLMEECVYPQEFGFKHNVTRFAYDPNSNFETLGDLAEKTEKELLDSAFIGKKTILFIKALLAKYHLKLAE